MAEDRGLGMETRGPRLGTVPFFRMCGEVFVWRWTLVP